jgi:nucleoside-diphosphate-sugar epimerase
MLKREKVYIGAPDSVRDYMYIDDHVNAYLLAMKKEEAKGQVFNVGTGVGTSNRELAEEIANKIGYNKANITFGSYPPGYAFRPLISDQPYIVLDATKIKTKLGWKTTVSLDDGLDKIISYFQSNPVLL